ncbi:MAG: hypothetical protein IPN02_00860 [Candidatus Microthrix sp.]|uniref:Uncharacterized protein n=1 Tax=Candidatus Neomicrothrix subdominans TaxID=2954438 RepID=A0A936N991_9ACTN|nr:hypothetical protein [Candidatus Microthrix subdominans]
MKVELIPVPVADPDGNTLTLQEMSWRTVVLAGHLLIGVSVAEASFSRLDATQKDWSTKWSGTPRRYQSDHRSVSP